MRHDRALRTAREFLEDAVCECGCVDGEHAGSAFFAALKREPRPCSKCPCRDFRPVRFRVERA